MNPVSAALHRTSRRPHLYSSSSEHDCHDRRFFDTIIIFSMAAFVLLSSGEWDSGKTSSPLTCLTFETDLPGSGGLLVTIGLCVFADSTMIDWAYYGEKCIEYIFALEARAPYRYLF